jgi:hypothetical protein
MLIVPSNWLTVPAQTSQSCSIPGLNNSVSCIYAEATADETMPNWIGAHVRAFEFMGAWPRFHIVPSQEFSRSALDVEGTADTLVPSI